MQPSKHSCNDWQLYVILDRAVARGRDLIHIAEAAIAGGADVLQLRDKTAGTASLIDQARTVLAIARRSGIPLIINDRPDVALTIDADGVHLGQDDLPIAAARRLLGPHQLIGRSTHSLEQALEAERQGADYLGIGPVFATPTKPDYIPVGLQLIEHVAAHLRTPWVAIGGIDASNVEYVVDAGARCVAVVRAVIDADDPQAVTRQLKTALAAATGNKSHTTSHTRA